MQFINYYIQMLRRFVSKKEIDKKVDKEQKQKINFLHLKAFVSQFSDKEVNISDDTWNDLNMDDVFCHIDKTITTCGEQVLYKMLKNPLFSEEGLKERGYYISYFQNHIEKRKKIQDILNKLGRINKDVTSVLCNKLKPNLKLKLLVSILPLLFFINIFMLSFIKSKVCIYSLIVLGLTNICVHYNMGYLIMEQIAVIQYIGRIINISNKLYVVLKDVSPEYAIKLKNLYDKCKIIGKRTSILSRIEGMDVFADYLNIIFLIKERNYFTIASYIEKFKDEIIQMYMLVGKLDALISIALYRDSIDQFVEPEFVNENKVLDVEGIFHPLLEKPVKNSLKVKNNGIIITGSNMSGKSTFMRTIGVNAIFAQTIYTCLANKYRTSFYNIVSSVSLNDDLIKGKSYYLCEAEAIYKVLNICEKSSCCLALIDEIFNGTNPTERIGAAVEILNYLAEKNTLTIVSTHDLQLIQMLKGYEAYYFKETVTKEGLKFDYHIRKGISQSRNAVKILEYLGYPYDLITRINKRVKIIETA
ncbi:MutS-related protein [Crassaminicella thermophila]|nr:DNA mismatch repair protein MutS [Crassaminicella thermophila]